MRFSSRIDRSAGNNRGVQQDPEGRFHPNWRIQQGLRDKVADDPNLRRGVTITSARGYRWDLSDKDGTP